MWGWAPSVQSYLTAVASQPDEHAVSVPRGGLTDRVEAACFSGGGFVAGLDPRPPSASLRPRPGSDRRSNPAGPHIGRPVHHFVVGRGQPDRAYAHRPVRGAQHAPSSGGAGPAPDRRHQQRLPVHRDRQMTSRSSIVWLTPRHQPGHAARDVYVEGGLRPPMRIGAEQPQHHPYVGPVIARGVQAALGSSRRRCRATTSALQVLRSRPAGPHASLLVDRRLLTISGTPSFLRLLRAARFSYRRPNRYHLCPGGALAVTPTPGYHRAESYHHDVFCRGGRRIRPLDSAIRAFTTRLDHPSP